MDRQSDREWYGELDQIAVERVPGPLRHYHYWYPRIWRPEDLGELVKRYPELRGEFENPADDVTILKRSLFGYVDRTRAYRRLRLWRLRNNYSLSPGTVMICRQWRTCSSLLL